MDLDYLVINWGRAFVLFAITFNPSGWSYLTWVQTRPTMPPGLVFFFSALLILAYCWFFKQTLKNLRGIGIFILATLMFSFVIGLAQLSMHAPVLRSMDGSWLLIFISSGFLAVGVSYRS